MSEIVLLDTRSDLNNIDCISIPFDENVPKYYAISYRWGILPEWKVQTPNYVASITSIPRGNLIKLCGILRGKHITEAEIVCAVDVLCFIGNLQTASRVMELFDRRSNDAATFILKVIQEWACRCWVISERVIGVKHNKLDIIALTANGADLPCQQWKKILPIDWNINFSQATLIDAVINSKSTKYVDRLYAILPNTRYKDAVRKLVDEGATINSMMDLKMALFDILDTEGKVILLSRMLLKHRDLRHVLPLFAKEERFQFPVAGNPNETYVSYIETTIHEGKRGLKVWAPYMFRLLQQIGSRSAKLSDIRDESVVYILLKESCLSHYFRIQCILVGSIWKVGNVQEIESPEEENYQRGEFVFF
ncbi:hypothetical protein EC973_003713 [Apophysomyces ossiformis]|uniref:Uncharacterized protein n=1 Tax=Apophysomyces ossiformis TaxID=679940 RepID=A0A8H7BLF2_9FUNG|nr:hypothetical protein EC973_003713 [Apophysomyces ossiformis]